MSNLLVIGDIHNRIKLADVYLKRHPNTPVIFLGDYFDDFGDSVIEAADTARWLKNSLNQPDRIHLIGNHDFPYMVHGKVWCPGWTPEKHKAVNEILTPEDWSKLKYFHYEKNFYFSHAGITEYWFAEPITGNITPERVENIINQCKQNIGSELDLGPIWAPDRWRGGDSPVGGILWCDWRGLDHIPNINQIVGHTPSREVIQSKDEELNSIHILADTFLKQAVLLSETGIPTIINLF